MRDKTLDIEKDDTVARLRQALDHLSMRESRIKLAFENGIDTLEEYGANKKRLLEERQHLQQELLLRRLKCQKRTSERKSGTSMMF